MSRMTEQWLYIHGGCTSTTNDHTLETINPTNGNMLATVQVAGCEDVDCAVKSAQQRQEIWATMTAMERLRILCRIVDILHECNNELVKLETLDIGKVYPETPTVDTVTGADALEYYAGSIPALKDSRISLRETSFVHTRREPLGVVTGISAWNYPIQVALWKPAPILATGNTMIFKPSEITPPIALKLTEIYSEVGLPGGILNVLPGMGAETEQYLTDHPGIAKVSLIGGVASGKKVMANSAASSLEEVTMELGNKSPLIIFDDVDSDLAADIVMMANFFSSNQVCTGGARVFVPTKCKAAFEQRVLARVERIRVGNVFDPQANFGPLVSFPYRDNVLHYIAKGKEEGTRILCDGSALKGDGFGNGAWVVSTVFTDCSDDTTTVREEIFGPVMSTLTYELEGEVIRRTNDTGYGLAAGIMTTDLDRVYRVIHRLGAGTYWISTRGESPVEIPAGDYKHSGIGRENGVMTLQSYIQVKSVRVEMTRPQSTF